MKMKILVTGANGLLGSNLCFMYRENFEVIATSRKKPNIKGCNNVKLDITVREDVKKAEKLNPDMIIHCAALTNVDYCEEHPEEAKEVHVTGSKNMAELARKTNSYLVHISTDAVFDGKKGNYSEKDTTKPMNIYGETKLEAEKEVLRIHKQSAVVRTTIYGWNKKDQFSIAEWMLDKLENDKELTGFKDIFFSPILVNNLGEAILELYELKYKGIINVAGSESCSKLEFAYKIAETFNLDKKKIVPIMSDNINFKAKRSKKATLNVEKAKRLLDTKLLNIKEGLERFKELRDNGYRELIKNR